VKQFRSLDILGGHFPRERGGDYYASYQKQLKKRPQLSGKAKKVPSCLSVPMNGSIMRGL
jgi:hypothetical protein